MSDRYPKRKFADKVKDSYVIYETGNRTTDYPPKESDFKDLIKESGDESDSNVTFTVNTSLLEKGESFPTEKKIKQDKQTPLKNQGYPIEKTWTEKILGHYAREKSRPKSNKANPKRSS